MKSDTKKNEPQFEMSEDVRLRIEKIQERKAAYKKQVLESIFQIINEICEKKNLSYFAISKLLTYALYDRDDYPETSTYFIGMLREDYDILFQELELVAEEKKIKVMPFYHKHWYIVKLHSSIQVKRVFEDELGKQEISLELRIEPYEVLPDDLKEREDFLRQAAAYMREYRSESRKFTAQRSRKEGKGFAKVKAELEALKKFSYFKNLQKKYRAFIHQYASKTDSSHLARVEMLTYPAHGRQEIYPIGRKDFGKTYIMTPADEKAFLCLPLEEAKARRIQGKFAALQALDTFCQKHGVEYFVISRLACHQYEPDNKDIALDRIKWNVGLVRKEYEHLIQLLEQEKETGGLVLKRGVDDYAFIKNHFDRVYMEEYNKRNPGDLDSDIQLYPFDVAPADMRQFSNVIENIHRCNQELDRQIKVEKGILDASGKNTMDSKAIYEKNQREFARFAGEEADSPYIYSYLDERVHVLAKKDVLPAKRLPVGDISAMFTKNEYLWHERKNEAYTNHIAKERLKILRVITDICREQGFEYFALSNLLVGAVVYQEAVPQSDQGPWELGFVREYYEKMLHYLREHAQEYGITLHEFCDAAKTLPLPGKFITLAGESYPTELRINLLPFDRVPEDFYVQMGFLDETGAKNNRYREMIWDRTGGPDRYRMDNKQVDIKTAKGELDSLDARREAAEIDQLAQSFADSKNAPYLACLAFQNSNMIHEKELYDLQEIPFYDLALSCPRDYSPWQPVLDAELERQVKCIQEICVPIVQEFDRVCKELGVGYFICGGTLLGYMRHGGYIPWDDDIDLGMLRADYDLFLEKAQGLLKEGFFLQTRETDANIPYLFSKIRLDGTVYCTEYNAERDFHKGISIDIFPFDYLPNDQKERDAFVKEVQAIAKEHNYIARNQYPEPEITHEPETELEKRYYKEQLEKKAYFWSQSLAESQKRYLTAATRYNKDAEKKNLKTVGSFVITFTEIDVENLLPYQKGVFEGADILLPKRPDTLMAMQYGDFMKMPPKHMRVAHRLVRWATFDQHGEKPKV